MDAVGGISDKYIEKYAVVEPVKHDRLNRIVIRRKWVYRLCACIAAIVIAVCIGIPVLNNPVPQYSFVLTAYALDNNNDVIAQNLTDSIQLPVSLLEMAEGSKGFLFSMDGTSRNDPPSLAIVTAGAYEYGINPPDEISGVHLEPGKQYFFFVGQDVEDFENVSFFYSDEETGSSFEICIDIAETENGYSASLRELRSFPTKTD